VADGEGIEFLSRTVIIATGGASYPRTGSTGDGYRLAAGAGHAVIPPGPGLVSVCLAGGVAKKLQGLTVPDARLTLGDGKGKKLAWARGDFIFTHFGVSGPAALALSREVSLRKAGAGEIFLTVDFMPEAREEELAGRFMSLALEQPRKSCRSLVRQLLPERLADVLAEAHGEDMQKKAAEAGREAWRKMAGLVKGLRLAITGTRPLEEAMVTVGGVSTGEIDPRTMASRLVEGLYFAGEVMDVDACTGGFNMQIAFSTGRLAGLAAAEKAYTESLVSGIQNPEFRIQNGND
jgi:predicted Rossmann fold flavoprotein